MRLLLVVLVLLAVATGATVGSCGGNGAAKAIDRYAATLAAR